MIPLLEICTLMPSQASGAWIAQFKFIVGVAEYEALVFLASLTEPIMVAQELIKTGAPLKAARHQFLHNVVLTTQH